MYKKYFYDFLLSNTALINLRRSHKDRELMSVNTLVEVYRKKRNITVGYYFNTGSNLFHCDLKHFIQEVKILEI